MLKRYISGTAISAILLGGIVAVQHYHLRPEEPDKIDEELLYFPNERLVRYFTAGLDSVVANITWVQTINYAAEQFERPELKHRWLSHMCDIVTALDPYYVDAYRYGGMFLAAVDRSEEAIQLLRRGLLRNPESFDISFELVQAYLLNRRDEPASQPLVIHYLGVAAERTDEPAFYLEWIDRIREKNSLEGEARRTWITVLESAEDQVVRDLAERKLMILDAEHALIQYNENIEAFRSEHGRAPHDLAELDAAGYAPPVTHDRDVGTFYLAPDDTVRNTITDRHIIERHLEVIHRGIRAYKRKHGALPESLAEIAGEEWGHPVPGHSWDYDPNTGTAKDRIDDPSVPPPADN